MSPRSLAGKYHLSLFFPHSFPRTAIASHLIFVATMAELRRAEQELERLKSEWKALRRKRACYDNVVQAAVDLSALPAWKDLMSKIVDEDIFPALHTEGPVEDLSLPDHQLGLGCSDATPTVINDEDPTKTQQEEAGYSEWGMLVTGGATVAQDVEVKTADQPAEASLTKVEDLIVDDDEEISEENVSVVNSSPPEVLSQLRSMNESVEILRPKIDKFIARLTEVRSYFHYNYVVTLDG
jgi:hypothetical protein